MKVAKFGGTSMANASCIAKVKSIVATDEQIKFVVVSAPGKRESTDTKITDLLYKIRDSIRFGGNLKDAFRPITDRFVTIAEELGVDVDVKSELSAIRHKIMDGASLDYLVSRGEYLSAKLMAAYLGWEFVDASELIAFDEDGVFDGEKTNKIAKKRLAKCEKAVIPGFYGVLPNGEVKTFSRGGSDITGAIVARATKCDVYENWTDVDGFMKCDPRIVENPMLIDMLTYKELRELSYMGANVLHPDSIFPVRTSGIPILIKNTFNPSAKGTYIVPSGDLLAGDYTREQGLITGIAGKRGFLAIYIEKSMMNNELGFGRKILSVIESNGLSFEHMPSGIDVLCVVVDGHYVSEETLKKVIFEIENVCEPDSISVVRDMAIISVVGHGMRNTTGASAKIFTALGEDEINVRLIDQGSGEMSIMIGVDGQDYERAIRALYRSLV